MEKKTKAPQVYGYAVCLVAIITFLISLAALISSVIDASDPLYARRDSQHLSSYENFKMNALKSGQSETAYMPDEETFRVMYEDAKNYQIRRVKHNTNQSIIVNSVIIVICVVLFMIHWMWIRRIGRQVVLRMGNQS